MERPNLTTAYRHARRAAPRPLFSYVKETRDLMKRGAATYALHVARAALLAYKNAAARYEDCAAHLDMIAADATPEDVGGLSGSAHREAVAEAERAKAKALKDLSAARVAAGQYGGPWGGSDYGAGTWQGGAVAEGPRDPSALPYPIPPAMRATARTSGPWQRFRQQRAGDGSLFYAHDAYAGGAFREVRDAHDVARLDHTGWFTDPYGDVFTDGHGLCVGVVARLRGRDGHAIFAPGYRFGGCEDHGTFDLSAAALIRVDVRGDECGGWAESLDSDGWAEAARAADAMAESAAEEEREWQTAWAAGSQWADKAEELQAIRAKVLPAIRELKAAGGFNGEMPATDSMIRDQIESLLEERADLHRERADLAAGDAGDLIFYPDERLRTAFCEGAGIERFPQ